MRQQVEWPGAGAGRGGGEPGGVRPPAQISGRCLGLELRARWRAGLCITTLAPRAPRFILAAGKPAAPADLLFGFVCASAAGADSPSFETSRPRRSAICSVCRGDALCRVCLQRSRAPCHVFPSPPRPPPHVKVALTSCSPHPVPGRRPRPGSEGSRSRGCGRSEPSRAGWGQPGSLAPCQGARQRLGRGQPLLSVCTGHVQILRRFVEGT